jgi:hypothetical protein
MSLLRAVIVLTAPTALACTYDFDRFEDAVPGSPGAAGAGGLGTGGTNAESAENGGTGAAGKPSSGEGGNTGSSCDELGGAIHDGHCYFTIAPSTGLLWTAAREACESYSASAHLATITSSAEQAAAEAAVSPAVADYWIGLSLADVERDPGNSCARSPESCPFEWVTGDTVSYSNWAEHDKGDVEPNYTGACVRLQLEGFTWADFDCSTRLPALCEDDG